MFFNFLQNPTRALASTHFDPLSSEVRCGKSNTGGGDQELEADSHALLRWPVKGSRVFTQTNGNVRGLSSAQAAACGRPVLIAALHKYVESSWALPARLEPLQVCFFFPPPPLYGSRTCTARVKHLRAKQFSLQQRRFFHFEGFRLIGIWSNCYPIIIKNKTLPKKKKTLNTYCLDINNLI